MRRILCGGTGKAAISRQLPVKADRSHLRLWPVAIEKRHLLRKKPANGPASVPMRAANLLLAGGDRVLCRLGDAELHHGLGGNLDCFAGLRIAAHARLTIRLH